MKASQFVVNAFQENCFVVFDEVSRRCMIVDPGMSKESEFRRVDKYIREMQLSVQHIVFTHFHLDHVMGAGFCVQEYGVGVSGSDDEQRLMPEAYMQGQFFGVACPHEVPKIEHPLYEGDRFVLGYSEEEAAQLGVTPGVEFQVIDCPGHSFHGYCYYAPEAKMLFSGDVLFRISVGRSDFGDYMGCNGQLLLSSIATKLFTLPQDVVVYPGHGPKTDIGTELNCNPYV